jgi:uncharacterized protein (DUF302 family)
MPTSITRRASLRAVALSTLAVSLPLPTWVAASPKDGIIRVKSRYAMAETIERIKDDIAAKGIMFFNAIDQAGLAKDAGIDLLPSVLLVFGNPPLGTLFLSANPDSGLDWPVRLLVRQDADGTVWAVYTDFAWIARRHGITSRDKEFEMAAEVIGSITASVAA